MGYSTGSRRRLMLLLMIYGVMILAANYTTQLDAQKISTTSSLSFPGMALSQRTDNASELLWVSDGNDTVRVDPFDNFNNYRGGYNITNMHYWTSTIFTGIYGYSVGILCLLCGLSYGGYLLVTTYSCCKDNREESLKGSRSPCPRIWTLVLAAIFTVLAMCASGVALGGNIRFNSELRTVVSIIVGTADSASKIICDATGAMNDVANNLETDETSRNASSFLTATSGKLDAQAAHIQREARKSQHLVNTGLKIGDIITKVAVLLNLVAVIALSVSGVLDLKRPFYMLIILCWLLTVICWMFFGVYLFLETFSGDTCTALYLFRKNPDNSSLSSLIPCGKLLPAKNFLFNARNMAYSTVNEVNGILRIIEEYVGSPISVCNPFSAPPDYHYQPDNCTADSIPIWDVPKVLRDLTEEYEFLSSSDYEKLKAYAKSIKKVLNVYAGMENLVECQLVKDAISEILQGHCNLLKTYVGMVWRALLCLSVVMVTLVSLWTWKARRGWKFRVSDGSVTTHRHKHTP